MQTFLTTVRSKEKFALEFDEGKGKNQVVSLVNNRFNKTALSMNQTWYYAWYHQVILKDAPIATVIKSRYAIFEEGVDYEFNEVVLGQLKSYLEEGADPETLLEAQKKITLMESKITVVTIRLVKVSGKTSRLPMVMAKIKWMIFHLRHYAKCIFN